MEKVAVRVREALFSVLENESLFLLAAFLLRGILLIDPLMWYMQDLENLYTYFLCPWGGALIAFELVRRHEKNSTIDMNLLLVLFAWITIPFLYRFGPTFNNSVTIIGYAMVFFGLYASLRGRGALDRRKRLREMSIIFTALSLIWGGLLIYCALTGTQYGLETGGVVFGVRNGSLFSGVHYNSMAMMAIGCLFMSIAMAECYENILLKILGVISAAMMVFVIILSQSRTVRYAMLLGLAAGAFSRILQTHRLKGIVKPLLALGGAAVVLIGGYRGAALATDRMLLYYAGLRQKTMQMQLEDSLSTEAENEALSAVENSAELETGKETPVADEIVQTQKARAPVDSTFSDRTNIWRNLFELWKSDPGKWIIGRGVGNTGSLIAHDTTHEADGTAAVHNTYLQFIADFGLFGFFIMVLFFICIIPKVFRAFFFGAAPECRGMTAMGMLSISIFAIGMMESAPLGQMTPTNQMLYVSLAYLVSCGEAVEKRHFL